MTTVRADAARKPRTPVSARRAASLVVFAALALSASFRLFGGRRPEERPVAKPKEFKPFRILHVVTSLTEYDSGTRGTKRGDDRFMNRLLPNLCLGVESMASNPYWEVDVYLVLGFDLSPSRKKAVEDALPEGVGLEIWSNATPFHYRNGESMLTPATHALARQHRFVLKDKLDSYDFFSCWEDDMHVNAGHVALSEEIDRVRDAARSDPDGRRGRLDAERLSRLFPGFVRVEVSSNFRNAGDVDGAKPGDAFGAASPDVCCSAHFRLAQPSRTVEPDDMVAWEVGVKGLGVRRLPGALGWSAMLNSKPKTPKDEIESYWTGTGTAFEGQKRPGGGDPQHFAQQGGFMATKEQILRFDEICPGGFLPPFSDKFWNDQSGLKPQNVEFWSGGYQLFGRCYLQRFMSLKNFSKHLIYHTSNNKQKTITRNRFTKVNVMLGQLSDTVERAKKDNFFLEEK